MTMKYGKRLCEKLKQIRLEVARANDIPYEPAECHYEGDCSGSCPRCEAEVKYLERQLDLKRLTGKIAVISMAVGALATFQSCGMSPELAHEEVEEAAITEEQDSTVLAPSDNSTNTIGISVDGK